MFTKKQFQDWGRQGGSVRSEAKAKAARKNAKKKRGKREKRTSTKNA